MVGNEHVCELLHKLIYEPKLHSWYMAPRGGGTGRGGGGRRGGGEEEEAYHYYYVDYITTMGFRLTPSVRLRWLLTTTLYLSFFL